MALSRWSRLISRLHADATSGFRLLVHGNEAFAVRATLAVIAGASINVQSYIFEDGYSTRLLLREVILAAERGVLVRLLLDDFGVGDQQHLLAELDTHPNIEVRLFNPSGQHRRLHNKLWLVDGAVAIVGGRNLSDDYFNINTSHTFLDVDVVMVGSTQSLTHCFDRYWQHDLAVPLPHLATHTHDAWRSLLTTHEKKLRIEYTQAFKRARSRNISTLLSPLEWASGHAIWDDPDVAAVNGTPPRALRISNDIADIFFCIRQRMLLTSGYFIPFYLGTIDLLRLRSRGVKITVFTNSQDAADIPLVHGGYAQGRILLLYAGVTLYEIRRKQRLTHGLHAKTMMMDDDRIVVGSLNLDPRSVWYNCEICIIISSHALNDDLYSVSKLGIEHSYRVTIENGTMCWYTSDSPSLRRITRETGKFLRSIKAWVAPKLCLVRYA